MLINLNAGMFVVGNAGPCLVFKVNGQPVGYEDQWPHLGLIITNELHDTIDILQRHEIMPC